MSSEPRGGLLIIYLLLLWPAALWLAWLLLARVDFMYPTAYRLLDIPATLESFVPHNRHGKRDFAQTDAAEHARLFEAISHAVRNGGDGLERLRYHDPQGRVLGTLLTRDEVTHLRDVAHLVESSERVGMLTFMGWLGLVALLLARRRALPGAWSLLFGSGITLILSGVAVWITGPVEVFYTLHRWIFPPDHPWFFYYQDSLMSSLMQAPNLFGFIGILWVFTALWLLLVLNAIARMVVRGIMIRRIS